MDLFTSKLFTEGILPFLLVFVLIFAVLQKSKLFGENKSQIDALISLAIALILIGVPAPRTIIITIIPWMAVALVVLFIVLVIYGFGGEVEKDKGLKLPSWFNKAVLALSIVFVIILVMSVTGGWAYISEWASNSSMFGNVIIVLVIAAVLWIALKKETK